MEILIVLFILTVIICAIYKARAEAKRRKMLQAWALSKGLHYTRGNNYGLPGAFPEFQRLREGHRNYACNLMGGDWSGREILAFDYHYETYTHDSKGRRTTHHHHFSAAILESQVPLKPLFIRPEGFFDKVTEFFGFDDIDFESAEFSRAFYVKAEDRRWAYDVIHTRTMQFLLDMPRFTLQFGPRHVIAYGKSRFDVAGFDAAVAVIEGILNRLPDYLVKQSEEAR